MGLQICMDPLLMDVLEFDYVIVGAGSAGCVLADRLTRCGKFTVLLLESGGSDARLWVKVPIGYAINVSQCDGLCARAGS